MDHTEWLRKPPKADFCGMGKESSCFEFTDCLILICDISFPRKIIKRGLSDLK
jgi:hypothetical protein